MATDSTNLPHGDVASDTGADMAANELDLGAVQLAQVTADAGESVDLPTGQRVVVIRVQPGQTIELPVDSAAGLFARIGPEGNLAIVINGRTIIFQGYVQANEQTPVRLLTSDGDLIDVADVILATNPDLDIQTAAGPATGGQGDTLPSSGIFTPFLAGPPLGGLDAIGVLDPTALRYKLIDDERRLFTRDEEDTGPTDIEITFDILGGIVNEDDLGWNIDEQEQQFAKLVIKDVGNDGVGNDPFDTKDREDEPGDEDGEDKVGNADPDPEPLTTQATVTVTFGPDIPGTLEVFASELPTGLKSEGQPIVYHEQPSGDSKVRTIFAFVDGGGDPTKFDDGKDRLVFEIKVLENSSDSVFHIDFTLHDNIDNSAPDQNDDGAPDLLGGVEQILNLPVKLTATDSDGTPLSTVMELGVKDDIPFFGEVMIGDGIAIINTEPGVVHDETIFPQGDADDQSILTKANIALLDDLNDAIQDAGFSLPFGDSVGDTLGLAQTQVFVSFGADQASQEQGKKADDTSARNSIFGELEDRIDADGDGLNDGENEHPFELFMIKTGSGGVPAEDDLSEPGEQGNLTIEPQKTNATVTWDGEQVLPVYVQQIDAHTIVGFVMPNQIPDGEQEAFIVDKDTGKEAVFVIHIDDEGKLSFVQLHQINHLPNIDPTSHDEPFTILGEDGEPIIFVRASDYDGDHAQQPVNIVIQDDGPKFVKVFWGFDGDSTDAFNGTGTIDEDALPNGKSGGPGDNSGGKSTDGEIFFDFGVDKPGKLSVEDLKITDSNGDPVPLNELKTADGQPIVIDKGAPAPDGTVIWTAYVDLGGGMFGDKVFTFEIDTEGGEIGEFEFELFKPLQHEFHDADSKNNGPETAFEDDLNLDFTIIGKDIDNDTAEGHIKIRIDDDSPLAVNDKDSVTEGKGNTATGNVVTAADLALIGTDVNGTDGSKDSPGADQPYTISKLTHDGDTYTLSADGATVLKNGLPLNGTTETFLGGVLKIPTDKGGTFEIVMKSATQSEVGEYRYTAGEPPAHASDKFGGPETLDDSRSAAFDTVSEWTSSFSTGAGVTLSAIGGGALQIKNIDVNPKTGFGGAEDYRGIGVVTGQGDEVEVDNVNNSEGLRLDFGTDTNNAKLTIGAFFDGVQFDSGFQEILVWQAFDNGGLVASGQILGSNNGLVSLDIDTGGAVFDRIELRPLNNGAGSNSGNNSDFLLLNVEICKQEPVEETFGYTLRDADGDESSATLTIKVDDTQPSIPGNGSGGLQILIDEDGLNPSGTIKDGIGDAQPGDAEEDHTGPNAAKDDAQFIGKIPFTAGADPVSIELSVGNGGDTGLDTVDGKSIFAAWDEATNTLIGYVQGTDPSDAGNQVFVMKVTNEQTGEFTFTLKQPIEHPDFDGQEKGDNENIPDPYFTVNVQIEDKDCDVAFTTVKVTIDDDMPVIYSLTADSRGTVIHDESAGEQDDDQELGELPSYFKGIPGAGPVIGWAEDGEAGVSVNFAFGADGPADKGSVAFDLSLASKTGVDSNVDTTDGLSIWLFQEGDIVVGRVGKDAGGGTADSKGAVAFAINIEDDGDLQVAQFLSLKHPNPNDPDEDIGLALDSLQAKVTITDADGDSVSKSVNIGTLVRFDDDAPDAKLKETDNVVQHDETAGVQNPGSGLDMDQDPAALPAEFGAIVGTLIGWAKSTGAVVSTAGTTFGADDEGATSKLSVQVSFSGVDSGIDDTATGKNILLYQSGDIVIGKVDGTSDVAFAISIDNPSGKINVAQYRAVEHLDPSEDDESIAIKDSALQVVLKVTDGDGDFDTETVNIGERVRFDDDAPSADIDLVSGAQIVLDESLGEAAGDGFPDDNANDEKDNVANDIAYAKVAAKDLFTDSSVFGQDGPGTKTFSLDVTGAGSSNVSGLIDAETNSSIFLVQLDADTVVGRVGSAAGVEAFRIDVDKTSGEVTVTQSRAVEHDNAGSSASDHDESGSPEVMDAGKLLLQVNVTDGDKDTDTDSIDLGLLIKFEDDGPIARNDVDALDAIAGDKFEAQGNVITGTGVTMPGVDDGGTDTPWVISKLEGKDTDSNPAGGFVVNGTYGKLTMGTNGQYTYDFDETNTGKVPSGSTEVFTYTLKDSDGDTDTATLTIKLGDATVTTSAVIDPDGDGCLEEDTLTPIALTATPGAGDKVTQIVLDDIPAGWTVETGTIVLSSGALGVVDLTGDKLTINITGAAAGVAITATVQVKAAADSDVDGKDLVVQATAVDGVVSATNSSKFDVTVDAVADGDDKGDDGDADALGVTISVSESNPDGNTSFQDGEVGTVKVTASYDDFKDGSEAHTLVIDAPAGFTFNLLSLGTIPAGVVLDGSSTTTQLVFKVDSKDGDGQNGVGDLELNIPVTYGGGEKDGDTGTFKATVTTTETPTDLECDLTNNTDSAEATTKAKIAGTPTTDVRIGTEGNADPICVNEDTTSAGIPVVASTTTGSHLTTIVISGFPIGGAGFTFNFTGLDLANTSISNTIGADGKVTITFDDAVSTNFSGTFTVKAPADSDLDLGTLTAVVSAVNNTDANVKDDDTDTAYVRVDAVADGKDDANGGDGDASVLSVSIVAADGVDPDSTFATGEKGKLTLNATFDDFKDGSEKHQVTIAAPAGFQFTGTFLSALPAGVVVNAASTATNLILDVDSKDGDGVNGVGSIAGLQIEIQNVSAPTGTTVNFTATASAVEQNKVATNGDGNDECTDANNSQSVESKASVTTLNDLLPIAYDDKVCVDEASPQNANLLLIFDVSGSMNADSGVPDPNDPGNNLTKLEAAKLAAINMLAAYGEAGGDVRVMLVWFNANGFREEAWLNLAEAQLAINAIPASANSALTSYEDAITTAIAAFNDTDGRGDPVTHPGFVYFLSDGEPTVDGNAGDNSITNGTLTAWDNLLELNANNIEHVYSIGLGTAIPSGVNNPNLIDVADPNGDDDPQNTVLLVDDLADLEGTLVGTIGTEITGNVLDGKIEDDPTGKNAGTGNDPDFLGDTPTHISYLAYDSANNDLDIKVTWDGAGALVVDGVANGAGVIVSGKEISFDTDHGRMTFDFTDGDFKFIAGSVTGDQDELFDYKITDKDGDVDPAVLTICIDEKFADPAPIARDNYATVQENKATVLVEDFNDKNFIITKSGNVTVDDSNSNEARISTSSAVAITTLESDLGLTAGTLKTLLTNSPSLVEGSGFSQAFTVAQPGSTVQFTYDYLGDDDDNDAAAYLVMKGTAIVAQGIIATGPNDQNDQTVQVALGAAGNDYKIVFVAVDRTDNSGATRLDIDQIDVLPPTQSVSGNVIDDANNTPPVPGSLDPNGAVDLVNSDGAVVTQIQYLNNSAVLTSTPVTLGGVTVETQNGFLTINALGDWTYVPKVNAVTSGTSEIDAFTYTLTDSNGDSDPAILRINITDETFQPPQILNGTLITNTDVQNQPARLTFTQIGNPANSFSTTLILGAQGQQNSALNFALDAGFIISASEKYIVTLTSETGQNIRVTDFFIEGAAVVDQGNFNVAHPGNGDGIIAVIQGNSNLTGTTFADETTPISAGPAAVNGAADDVPYLYLGNEGSANNDTYNPTVAEGAGIQVYHGGAGDDTLSAGASQDLVMGGLGKDTLNGGDGNDTLYGDDGDDILNGGNNDDAIFGGAGNDTIDVSLGNDRVMITSSLDGNDVVNSFDNAGGVGNQDFIDLDRLFDSLGVADGGRVGRVQVSDGGADALVTIDLTGNGFGAGDIQIKLTSIADHTTITVGTAGTDDVQVGTL